MSDSSYMKSYRILTGKTTRLSVPTRLIGRLWRDGGETTRAMLSVALESDVLDACVRVDAHGPAKGTGKGNPLNYSGRRGPAEREPDEVDSVVIERILAGDRLLSTTRAERDVLIGKLTDRGLSAAMIARRLGIAQRTVTRIRTQAKEGESYVR
ncbi:hypothetical protein EF294_07430 [Gordonia oryzae]|uniref:Uncharacterized protein n=1 Tax=Gordonia oryzae TaxID=2487349 RepID=A0A3N4GW20_9ACTN|nr:hypothetical protein [Gordonia oryzae]RPA64906.1 hypothetical protein EF294_07430 [Gordonia oryzae]